MKSLSAVWRNGQVVLDGRADWAEGCRLVVKDESSREIEFMTEDEQKDDPVAIQQWIAALSSFPPVPEDPADEAERLAWEARMRLFNIEAVRKQFEVGES